MTETGPSLNGANSRAEHGRFSLGNRGGPGNPFAAATAKLRKALLGAITAGDVTEALEVLRQVMRNGKHTDRIFAARELLDRSVGKPKETIEQEIAVLAEQGVGLDMTQLEPAELEKLRSIRSKIRDRASCAECQKGSGPCAQHRI